MLRCFFFNIFICFLFYRGFSQQIPEQKKSFYEINLHIGKVVKNWPTESFPKSNVSILSEIKFGFQHTGSKYWHAKYRYPQSNLSLILGYLGNNNEFGQVFGIVPSISLIRSLKNASKISINAGLGFAWFNKPYNDLSNPNNILIGSAITNLSIANFQYYKPINKKIILKMGFSAFHCSNAHFQVPNVGMNIPAFNFGLQYFPNNFAETPTYIKHRDKPDSIKFNLSLGFGIHEFAGTTRPTGGPKYLIPTVSIYFSKILNKVFNVQIGLNTRYYPDFKNFIQSNNLYKNKFEIKASTLTFFLGNDLIFGRFSLLSQGGINLYNPFYKKYHRIQNEGNSFSYYAKAYLSSKLGIQYVLLKDKNENVHLIIGTYIKANFGTADFVETSLTYRW